MLVKAKSLLTLSFLAVTATASHRSPALGYAGVSRHLAVRRQAPPASASQSTYTYLTPSPGAVPVPITQQHQAVTSFAPVITVCPQIDSSHADSSRPSVAVASAGNAISGASNDSCSTSYSPVVTTICHTTLQALLSAVTVTACDQQVTFSERPPQGVADAATTFYIASWSDVTPGAGVPSSVTEKVCTVAGNENSPVCVDNLVEPRTVVVTSTATSTTELKLTTNIKGPAKVTIQTLTFDITNADSTIALNTQLLTEYSTESTSTSYNTVKTGALTGTSRLGTNTATTPVSSEFSMPSASAEINDMENEPQSSQSASGPNGDELPTSTRTTTVSVTVEGEGGSSTTTQTNMHTAVQSVTMTRPLSLATPQLKLANNATS